MDDSGRLMLSFARSGRLTLTTAVPVTTSDVTGASTLYYTPYRGNHFPFYDGSAAWPTYPFSETSLALSGMTTNVLYDVFLYLSGGVPTLEKVAWASGTARTTAADWQNGWLVKNGTTTKILVGTFRATAATTTEDSAVKRFLANAHNTVLKPLYRHDATGSYTYSTDAYRQANASAANQVELVQVFTGASLLQLQVHGMAISTGGNRGSVGIGENSTTALATEFLGGMIACSTDQLTSGTGTLIKKPALGYSYYAWLERMGGGTGTWYSDGQAGGLGGAGAGGPVNAGLTGWWEC